ncbi:hypothetical protein [Modicisalibacter radicis]|uniref:hypothetical protein n=1 Tax=Halomonas sp. EAR18 TaxID=2518972 RepID=UPI00109D2A09|nr:hypothetical protein [Halomonas sp. EAR18]
MTLYNGPDAGADIVNEILVSGTDVISFDLLASEISYNVEIETSSTDLQLTSSDDLTDGQNDIGAVIEDFFTLENGDYAFNDDNVVEYLQTSDSGDQVYDLQAVVDLAGINAAYDATQTASLEIA